MTILLLYIISLVLMVFSLLEDKDKTKQALRIAFKFFENVMPQFLGIIFIIGIILSVLNTETISSMIGESSGFLGILFSSIIGSITIMPTFVAFSMGDTLLKSGAGYAQVGALISTLTMVGLVTFSLESKYIGKKGAFLRNLFAFMFSFIVAVILEKVMVVI